MKVSRDDPCPCGSGKKYKRCHLAADQAETSARLTEERFEASDGVGDPSMAVAKEASRGGVRGDERVEQMIEFVQPLLTEESPDEELDEAIEMGLCCWHLALLPPAEIAERLRGAGFQEDINEKGNPTHQRWRMAAPPSVTVDFLIAPGDTGKRGGSVWNLEPDFAAIVAPGLALAFRDRVSIKLSGKTIVGEHATRNMWVCGPGAFVVLKALASLAHRLQAFP